MLAALIMSFRESFEIYLFILPLIIYLYKVYKPQLNKNIYIGLIAGLLLSIATGFGLSFYFKSLQPEAIEFIESCLKTVLAGLIVYAFIVLNKMNKAYDFNIVDEKLPLTGFSLFMISLVTVFREGIEVVIYTLPNLISNPLTTIIAIILGILLSSILILIIFKTTFNINITIIFSLTTLFLIYIGSECFGEALMYFFPQLKLTLLASQLIYSIPLLYFFIKSALKRYIKRKM